MRATPPVSPENSRGKGSATWKISFIDNSARNLCDQNI